MAQSRHRADALRLSRVRGAPRSAGARNRCALLEDQHEIIRLAAGGAPLTDVLDRLTRAVEEHAGPALCWIVLIGSEGQRVAHDRGRLPIEWQQAVQTGDRDTLPWERAIRTREIIAIEDIGASAVPPELHGISSTSGARACLSWPVLSQAREVLGVVNVLSPDMRPADRRRKQAVLDVFAPLVAMSAELDRSAKALRSADERFTSLAASIPGVVYQRRVTPGGDIRYTYISDGVRDLFGVTPEEVLADPTALFSRHGPEYAADFRQRLMAASRDLRMWDVEASIISRDGQQKFTHAIARPYRQPDGSVLWNGLILDATRIKKAEIAAAAAEARTREAIVESLSQGFVMFDAEDRLSVCNSAFRNLYPNLVEGAVPGVGYRDLVRAEFEHCAGAGERPIDERVEERLRQHALRHHTTERRLADGRWVLVHERRTPDGGTVVLHTDITKLREREDERNQLQEQFFRAQKMEAMGRLAGGIAHDFNNLLASILGNGQFLLEDLPRDSETWEFAEQIVKAGERAKQLVQQILAFSRKESAAFEKLDCADVVQETVQLLRAALPKSIDLDVRSADGWASVRGNATQLVQVLMNLCVNARDAIGDAHGKIALELDMEPPPAGAANGMPQAAAGKIVADPDGTIHVATGARVPGTPYVRIRVRDTGSGMGVDTVEKMFEPFFTTKGVGKGTGLGLAAVHGIVSAHNGIVAVTTKRGAGTSFEVFLPACDMPAESRAGRADHTKPRGREAVLVIDDEQQVRLMLTRLLGRLGYKVDSFGNGRDALEAFEKSPDGWALAITDQAMPQMTGYELAQQMLRKAPRFPIILCSGYADTLSAEAAGEAGIRAFLSKPVDPELLARTIREVLPPETRNGEALS